jgi:hypothetical protein
MPKARKRSICNKDHENKTGKKKEKERKEFHYMAIIN